MASGVLEEEFRLGRYLLKRQLGEGGNGQVFLAWQQNAAGEPLVCVVKFPRLQYATDDEAREAFLHEARLAMRLGTHPHVVQVIDVDVHQGMPFIVMEYVDGIDLMRLLTTARSKRTPVSLPAAYNLLAGAAEALHHAHYGATIAGTRVGIVHRDVKPANLLVTRDGVTKLGDFGIGTTVEDGTSGQYMRGTHRYMSPEHLRCELCPEMDIYALGIVAWELLENRQYREGARGTQHFTAIMNGDVPAMQANRTPRELVSLVEPCLSANLRQRPKASDFLQMLARCPGYTRDPSELRDHVAAVIGTRRSSGKTEHDFEVPPELAAVFTALDAVQNRAKGSTRKVVHVEPPDSTTPGPHRPEPLDAAQPRSTPRATKPWTRPDITPKIRTPFFDADDVDPSARDADLPDDAETDAPRLRRKPRRLAEAEAMTRVPLSGEGPQGETADQESSRRSRGDDDDDAPASLPEIERGQTARVPLAKTPGRIKSMHAETAPLETPVDVARSGVVRIILIAAAVAVGATLTAIAVSELVLTDDPTRTSTSSWVIGAKHPDSRGVVA